MEKKQSFMSSSVLGLKILESIFCSTMCRLCAANAKINCLYDLTVIDEIKSSLSSQPAALAEIEDLSIGWSFRWKMNDLPVLPC